MVFWCHVLFALSRMLHFLRSVHLSQTLTLLSQVIHLLILLKYLDLQVLNDLSLTNFLTVHCSNLALKFLDLFCVWFHDIALYFILLSSGFILWGNLGFSTHSVVWKILFTTYHNLLVAYKIFFDTWTRKERLRAIAMNVLWSLVLCFWDLPMRRAILSFNLIHFQSQLPQLLLQSFIISSHLQEPLRSNITQPFLL